MLFFVLFRLGDFVGGTGFLCFRYTTPCLSNFSVGCTRVRI